LTSDRLLASLISGSAIPVKRQGLSGFVASGGASGYDYSGTHGYIWTNNAGKQIDVFEHGTTTNATNIADMDLSVNEAPTCQTDTVMVTFGGNTVDNIQEYTIGSASNATTVADLERAVGRTRAKAMDGTHGFMMGGFANSTGTVYDDIQSFEFSTTTDAIDIALLSRDTSNQAGGINGNDKSIAYSLAGFNGSDNINTVSSYEMGTGTTATAIATQTALRDICSMQNNTYIWTGGGGDVTKFEIGTTTNSASLGNMSVTNGSYGTSQSTTHGYIYGGNTETTRQNIYEYEFDSSATITDVADLSVISSGTNASGSGTP